MELPVEKRLLLDVDIPEQYPRNPSYVLLRVYRQLSSTVEMMRTLAIGGTKHIYNEARAILTNAKKKVRESKQNNHPDISPLIKVEHSIRDLFLALLSNIAHIHGIEEPKRIYDHRDTIGPLNQGYNALGAIIREQFCSWYPFSQPQSFEHKEGSDGRTIPQMGYQGKQTGTVLATHIYQVSMDFQDVIRDHERLLNLYLTINQVPLKERRRFFTLFLLRMKPHIDYIFCERACGLPGFEKRARTILKELRDLSKALFIQRNGIEPTITGRQRKPKTIPEAKRFFNSVIRNSGTSIIEMDKAGISNCLDEEYFTDDDVIHLYHRMERTTRIRGSQTHDRIKQKLASTTQLRRAIFQGDELTDDPEWLICSELSLETQYGKGKADLTVFRRVSSPDNRRALHLPVAVYDTKTKTGFELEIKTNIEEEKTKVSEEGQDDTQESKPSKSLIIPEFKTSPRPLTHKEWNGVIAETPGDGTIQQLTTYTKSIGTTYRSLTGDDSTADPLIGTLLMDSTERFSEHRPHFTKVLIDVSRKLLESSTYKRTLYSPVVDGIESKTGIIVHKQTVSDSLKREASIRSWTPLYDPLESSKCNKQRFILYLSERLNGSGGISGAWIARYFHLIRFLLDLKESQPDAKILWFDCADEFSESKTIGEERSLGPKKRKRTAYSKRAISTLARTRLRLSDHQDSTVNETTNLFNSIQFIPVFDDIYAHIFAGKELDSIRRQFQSDNDDGNRIIIITGIDVVRSAIPSHFMNSFNDMKREIIKRLTCRNEDIIIWNDSSQQTGKPAVLYNRKTLIPFFDDSLLRGVVNEIVWNLPIRPAKPPYYYHTRGIVHQTMNGFEIDLISVPPLYDWGRRFNNRSPRKPEEYHVPSARIRVRMKGMLLTLIPWLVELHPKQEILTGKKRHTAQEILSKIQTEFIRESKNLSVKSTVLKETKPRSGLDKRVKYQSKTTSGGKGYVESVFETINASRSYYQHRQFSLKPSETSDKPPRERYLYPPKRVELDEVFLLELNYLQRTISILQDTDQEDQIIQSINKILIRQDSHLALIENVHRFLSELKETSKIWKSITKFKEKKEFGILTPKQAEALRGPFETEPNLLSFCGLHRSLMILWLVMQYPRLDEDDIQWFCELVRPWTLLQLGFRERYPKEHITGNSEYDVLPLWDDLVERAKVRALLPKVRNSRVRFGVGIRPRNSLYEWIIMEDTNPSRRLLSGLFNRSDLEDVEEQIAWSVSRLDVVHSMCSGLDTQGLTTKYVFLKKNKEWYVYRWNELSNSWFQKGTLMTISRGISASLRLRGFTIQSDSPSREKVVEDYNFDVFVTQTTDELDRIKHHLQGIKHVRLSLGVEGSKYRVGFIDPSSKEEVHSIAIVSSVDLVRLLRWPLEEGRELKLSSGDRVTWDPLNHDDIDYGSLSDFRSLVRTSRADATTFTAPATLEGISFKIEVIHDDVLCPLLDESSDEHGACWRLRHTGIWPEQLLPEGGIHRGFTDEQVYDIISIYGGIGKKLNPDWKFVHRFSYGERLVFNTSAIMRELISEKKGISKPQSYPPTLYKAYRNLRWRVSLRVEDLKVIWETYPTLQLKDIEGDSGEIDIETDLSLDDMVDTALSNIIKRSPDEGLADAQGVKHRLRLILGKYYSSLDGKSDDAEQIQEEVSLIESVLKAENALGQYPSHFFLHDQSFINLATFYHEQGRVSETVETLDRVLEHYGGADTSFATRERLIEVLEMKGNLLKEMGRQEEMMDVFQQILTIGKSIPDPPPKTEKILSEVASILNDHEI